VKPRPRKSPYTVLIVGGSQGARALNQCLIKSLPLFQSHGQENVSFIHQTGEADYNAVKAGYSDQWPGSEVCAFIDNIVGAFSRADLVVCRAGATTVAELAAAGKASILVPYPSATDQHQLQNAKALERAGAAYVIEQKDLTPSRLVECVMSLLGNRDKLAGMERRAKSLASPMAASCIADLLEDLSSKRKGGRGPQMPAKTD
jgi:UDP-N-acetylglucosamine--N-acetylmuramyl-(pentapeptide) pyrophosphoryl-undecaprenol N-acetylglucosamine transferase